jgi:hypothetical protein
MSAIYPLSKQRLMEYFLAGTTPTGVGFYCVAVDSTYTYDAAHENVADITPSAIVAAEQALASETILSGGALDADNVSYTGLTAGNTIDATIVYAKWMGGDLLFAYINDSSDGSLPQLITGTEAQINWNASGIFKL